jgi:tetratricopeptide (TPR) repeat protein
VPRKVAPTPPRAAPTRAELVAAARDAADRDDKARFQKAMADLAAFPADGPAAVVELVGLHARGGDLSAALKLTAPLADPAATAAVIAHAADRAVRRRTNAGLPQDLFPGFVAVLTAFEKYEAGDDDAARTALDPIGLRSPFLEWKVLLRGLMAFTAGDDARAVENWQRLQPDRVPARFAAPFRAQIDPSFRTAELTKEYRAVSFRGLVEPLERLRAELGRDRPLSTAFRHAETLVPTLRRIAPDLEPKLARCFYRAILDHGDPADLTKYRQLFGAPADDPEFHRLQALAYEGAGELPTANRHWTAYEKWLATGPAGWPADLAGRARAIVLYRLGRNATAMDADDDSPLDLLFGPPRSRRKPRAKVDPLPFFRRAADLAPDWPDPARELVNLLTAAGELADAEGVARRLLDRAPTAVGVLDPLAAALQRAGRAADALDLRTKALGRQPARQTDPRSGGLRVPRGRPAEPDRRRPGRG